MRFLRIALKGVLFSALVEIVALGALEQLAAGERVVAFPESAATVGEDVLPFRPSVSRRKRKI